MKRYRSAVTGRFVSAEAAAADPDRTIGETVKPAPKPASSADE